VALYTSLLPRDGDQIAIYANFLATKRKASNDPKSQRTIDERLWLAGMQAHLSMQHITEMAVQQIAHVRRFAMHRREHSYAHANWLVLDQMADGDEKRTTEKNKFSETEQAHVSEADLQLIYSLRWLCFDPQQRRVAMIYINALLRKFLSTYKTRRNELEEFDRLSLTSLDFRCFQSRRRFMLHACWLPSISSRAPYVLAKPTNTHKYRRRSCYNREGLLMYG